MKKLIALILAVVMVFGLVACGQKAPEATPEAAPGATPEVAPGATPEVAPEASPTAETKYLKMELWPLNETLGALKSTFVNGNAYIHRFLFTSLLLYNVEEAKYVPNLAEEWEISPDGKVYTVKLGDHKFHDGSPITADDVVFTYTMGIRAAAGKASLLRNLEGYAEATNGEADTVSGIKKIDDKTITFTLTQPDALFIDGLALGYFSILPAKYFEGMSPTEINDNTEFWANPVGSGAYMIDETAYPSYVTLKRFDDFYEPAGIENVLFTYFADEAARETALIAGELHFSDELGEETAANLLAQNPTLTKEVLDSFYFRGFKLNFSGVAGEGTSHPDLANPRVRHAINLLLDKEAYCQLYGADTCVPMTSFVPNAHPSYNTDLPAWKRDVEEAKKILDEEGFHYDIPIRIFSNYTDQIHTDFLELVVQNFAEAGITVTYTQDSNYAPYFATTDYDIYYFGGMFPNAIETYVARAPLTAAVNTSLETSILPVDDAEYVEYWRARYDDLIDKYLASTDSVEQKEILNQIQYNAYEDMYEIPLYCMNSIKLFNYNEISGMKPYARDYEAVLDLELSEWKLVD